MGWRSTFTIRMRSHWMPRCTFIFRTARQVRVKFDALINKIIFPFIKHDEPLYCKYFNSKKEKFKRQKVSN